MATDDRSDNEMCKTTDRLLGELAGYLVEHRTKVHADWVRRIMEAHLLSTVSQEEVLADSGSLYDRYLDALRKETLEDQQASALALSEPLMRKGIKSYQVVGIMLLLRDAVARFLFAKYQSTYRDLDRILDAFELAANNIVNTVAAGFVWDRERIIHDQREAARSLSALL